MGKPKHRNNHRAAAKPAPLSAGARETQAPWRDDSAAGFSPAAVLHSPDCPELWRELSVAALPRVRSLSGLPEVPAAALADPGHGLLFVSGLEGGLCCLEAETGRTRWSLGAEALPRPKGLCLFSDRLLAGEAWTHRVLALDPRDGSPCGELTAAGGPEDRLFEPWDLAVAAGTEGPELWVCDRSHHRICRYDTSLRFRRKLGRRGLEAEELARRHTCPAGEPEELLLEFPQALVSRADRIYLWDAWNRRVVTLTADGRVLARTGLLPAAPGESRFFSDFTVAGTAAHPLFLALDDRERSLTLWNAEGEFMLRLRLEQELGLDPRQAAALRFVRSTAEGAPLGLLASGGALAEFPPALTDPVFLAERLTALHPENPALALYCRELAAGAGRGLPPELAPALLRGEEVLSGRLERMLARLDHQAEHHPALAEAITARLAELALAAEEELAALAGISREQREPWAKAMAELDMALFRNNGRNSVEESRLDPVLEELREHPARLRRAGWRLGALRALLESRLSPAAREADCCRIAARAGDLLELRARELDRLEGLLSYDDPPQQVKSQELCEIHSALILARGVLSASGGLARELGRSREHGGASAAASVRLTAAIGRCARLDGEEGKWAALAQSLEVSPAAEENPDPADNRQQRLRRLVEQLADHLEQLPAARTASETFSRVLRRQRELFVLKASLLARAEAAINGTAAAAHRLAGEIWSEGSPFRNHLPPRRVSA